MKKLAVANGTYKAQDGTEKTKWVNIGILGTSANGKEYILLDKTINLAGFETEPGKTSVMVGVFEDQPKQQPQQQYQQQQPQYGQTTNGAPIVVEDQQRQQPQQQAPQQQYQQPSQQSTIPSINVDEENIPF